ncbi:MAG: Fe-S cluster assembly protein NifU [Desulfobulbaceae bacterium]|nr:Fe-S cluster assembly protein NifU [Desulfobulbaceae bacterium]
MWNYTETVKDHFLNPRNVGEVDNPDGVGEVGSLACGDALKLTFKLNEAGRIVDARFKTFGCASAIASSSALTEMIKGISLDEAENISNEDIAEFLGGLPKEKMHCSVMGREALEAAIANYRGVPLPTAEGELVCECFGVTDVEIVRAVKESNLTTVEDVTNFTKAGGGCEKCHDRIQELILSARAVTGTEIKLERGAKRLTNIKKIKLIEEVLNREIRPALKKDGGDIELIDVDGDYVYVSLRGACVSCSASQVTLKDYVEKKLREQVLETLIVEEE